jgi:hypothetical protein
LTLSVIYSTASLSIIPRNDPIQVEDAEYWANVFSALVNDGDNPMEPMSGIVYPVVNRFDRIQTINQIAEPYPMNDVVGAVVSNFYWRDVLKKVLSDGKKGLVAVVAYSSSSVSTPSTYFTYQIK